MKPDGLPFNTYFIPSNYTFVSAGSSKAKGLETVELQEGDYLRNHGVAHEFGHLYMKRALNRSGSLGASDWVTGRSWHRTRQGSETAATSEEWADFFAAATYFEPGTMEPYYSWCGDRCDAGSAVNCPCASR